MGRRGRSNAASPLAPALAESLADTMFALSTTNRVQILYALLDRPHDVSELMTILTMEQSAVSHQLRVLRDQALVRVHIDGKRRVYALADEHVAAFLQQAAEHVTSRQRALGPLGRKRTSARTA